MKVRITIALAGSILILTSAFGQISSSMMNSGPGGQFSATVTFNPPPILMSAVKGAPYSAIEISERTQILADGTHISQPSPSTRVYRDSAGRTRTERPFLPMAPVGVQQPTPMPNFVEINDTVAGYWYILDPINKVAHRCQLSPPPGIPATASAVRIAEGVVGSAGIITAIPGPVRSAGTTQRPDFSSQSLGTRTIEGVTVEGRLTKTTYPVGMMGNDQPLVSTSESWISPELRISVLTKSSDLRSGDYIRGLTNISRAEPDPALFQAPQGYRVVDETGPFKITITRP